MEKDVLISLVIILILSIAFSVSMSQERSDGWVEYIDTNYTTSNRITIGTTKIPFPNNAGLIRDLEKPEDLDTWYNGTHILARRPGDGILLRVRFNSEPQDNNLYCELTNNITLPQNLKVRTINFPKGIGIEQLQSFTNFEYQLNSWYLHGGQIYIECSGDVEIWNIEMTISSIHKGIGNY